MALINLKTNLKSIKFGVPPATDKPDGGNSNQPFMIKAIPDGNTFTIPNTEDFLLRGGLNAPATALRDVARLTKYMFTTVNGPLFVAKQNALSQISVRTQSSGKGPNEGIYTPLSTLTQAGIGFTGGHVPKQGVNPFGDPTRYLNASLFDEADSRLVQLAKIKIGRLYKPTTPLQERTGISPLDGLLLSYRGGPGSNGGIGKTNIKIAAGNRGGYTKTRYPNYFQNTANYITWTSENVLALGGGFTGDLYRDTRWRANSWNNFYQNTIQDFREPLIKDKKRSTIMGLAPAYNNGSLTIEGKADSRVHQESPGQRGNVINYTKGKIIGGNSEGEGGRISVVDKINFQPIYKSGEVRKDETVKKNDLVKFRMGTILRDGEKVYNHFRAFINSFGDNYNSSWDSIKYMGRGESFYKYQGFDRKISLSFTVAAQSKPELMAQYKKLNFLASSLAPDYGDSGYMGGVLTTLTMGGWCYELPGFINSLGLEVPIDSPWEIAINEEGEKDSTLKQMPHICNVNMEFTPIHTFRPELQKNTYDESGNGEVTTYGNQRYIALEDGDGANYNAISLKTAETNS
tara:strand:+ start:2160 stop:3878 length:1719 start_codon:yes stop_codon:yes gene_type:complete